MSFSIGDKVKILNENAEGTVTKIISIKFVLVQVGDFEYEYAMEHLIKVEKDNSVSISEKIHPLIKKIIYEKEIPVSRTSKKIKLKKNRKAAAIREVDLHIENLLENYSGMSNTEIMNYQLKKFLNELENAVAGKEKHIIFIHGKGEGILKNEIRRILKSHDFIFYDAPMHRYGTGATEVEIH